MGENTGCEALPPEFLIQSVWDEVEKLNICILNSFPSDAAPTGLGREEVSEHVKRLSPV